MTSELFENAQMNREFMYRYVWRLFVGEPDAELLALCSGEIAGVQAELFFGEEAAGFRAHQGLAGAAAGAAGGGDAAAQSALEGLRSEFTRLFVGPAKPLAPLWESVYCDPDELIFQKTTLDVRAAYRAAGFKARAYPNEADDHLAIELDFMAALTVRALESYRSGDAGLSRAYLAYQKAFLENHLNRWLGELVERLSRALPEAYGDFYLYAATLARELCDTDVSVIDSCMEMIA